MPLFLESGPVVEDYGGYIDYLYQGTPIIQLTIPDGTKRIRYRAFYGSQTIASVVFPDGFEEIGDEAFMNCRDLESVYNAGNIGVEAFRECQRLKEVHFAEGATIIGDAAFFECPNLTTIHFPESLEKIGSNTFGSNYGSGRALLKDVKFGSNLRYIGERAFSSYFWIDDEVEDDLRRYGDNLIFNGSNAGSASWQNLKLPQSLEYIGAYAFAGCKIATVELPSNIQTVGFGAFFANPITEIKIPASMTKLSEGMLFGCYNLNKVELHDNISSIDRYALALTGIRHMDIPSGVSSIDKGAFSYSNIVSVTFPETLTSIGEIAFLGTAMASFDIPNGVKEIGRDAFGSLHYLKVGTGFSSFSSPFCEGAEVLEMASATPPQLPADRLGFTPSMVLVPEGAGEAYRANNRWKDYNIVERNAKRADIYLAESGTLAAEIRLQSGIMPGAVTNLVLHGAALNSNDFAIIRSNMPACYEIDMSDVANTSIPSGVFGGKAGLLSITLPKGLQRIENNAFENCYTATFNIPSTITSIGNRAFANCESMNNELVFENTLKSIGESAFEGCRSLKSIDLSALDDVTLSKRVFYGCYALNKAVLPTKLKSLPDYAFSNAGVTRMEIPATTKIGMYAFQQCHNLEEVVFEDGFNGFGSSTFIDCTGLTTVILPESVTKIGISAFGGCSALQNIELPTKLTSIESSAFAYSGLNSITIPASVKSISSSCFEGSGLVYADIEGATHIENHAFANCPNLVVVNLPATLLRVSSSSLNSPSLSAINSPSLNPATTTGDPFADVSNVTCALSIPRPSFAQYLSAEYWGKFVSIRNCIDTYINLEDNEGNAVEDDSENPACELTYMDEGDYQEMLEDMENEEENGDNAPQSHRRAMRIMRANGVAAINRGYGKLFNNASLFLDDDSETRFFLGLSPNVENYTVTYNGQDITNEIDPNTMSFVIKGLKSMGNLVITVSGDSLTGIKNTYSDLTDGDDAPIYNLSGLRVTNPTPGIYIKGGKKIIIK